MALSGPTRGPIRISSTGIESALRLAKMVPRELVIPTIEGALEELTELGINLMALNIMESIRTEKSTGALEASIQGYWERIRGSPTEVAGAYAMEIGSPLPHAKYVSREIGMSTINRNVLIQSGKWRFIGIRGPIPKHPFLERTLEDLHKVMPSILGGLFFRYTGEVQREVDELERVSP